MTARGRLGLIALCLLALSVPTQAACDVLAEQMASCHMTAAHEMKDCDGGASVSSDCCEDGQTDGAGDLVLQKPGEEDLLPAAVLDLRTDLPPAIQLSVQSLPDAGARGRPPGYRLFSTLLL